MMRTCRACGRNKPLRNFQKVKGGKRRHTCRLCRSSSPEDQSKYRQRWRLNNPHSAIIEDCRASDRKKGLVGFDLDHEFVRSLIANGCRYCGLTNLRMTLDRVDNELAHTRANVVPCCIRCNYIRGSMPYAAWVHIVPAIREAVALGLFGDWRSLPFNRRAA
jgi:hypothetical protein